MFKEYEFDYIALWCKLAQRLVAVYLKRLSAKGRIRSKYVIIIRTSRRRSPHDDYGISKAVPPPLAETGLGC